MHWQTYEQAYIICLYTRRKVFIERTYIVIMQNI